MWQNTFRHNSTEHGSVPKPNQTKLNRAQTSDQSVKWWIVILIKLSTATFNFRGNAFKKNSRAHSYLVRVTTGEYGWSLVARAHIEAWVRCTTYSVSIYQDSRQKRAALLQFCHWRECGGGTVQRNQIQVYVGIQAIYRHAALPIWFNHNAD